MDAIALLVVVVLALVHVALLAGAALVVPSIVRFETASSARSLKDVTSWQPFTVDECQGALLLFFLSGLTLHGLRGARPRTPWWPSPSSWLPRASGLGWLNLKLLDGTLRSLPFKRDGQSSAHVSMRKLRRSVRRRALGSVAAAARVAARASERAADMLARVQVWRRRKDQRYWNKPSVRVVPQRGRMRWRCSSAPALRRARSTRWKRECPHPQRFQLASGRKPGERRRWKLSLNPPINSMHISGLRTCTTCRILHCAQSGSAIQNYPKTRFFV